MTGNPIDDSSRLCVDMYGSNEEDLANSAKWMTTQCDQLRGYACRVSKGRRMSRVGVFRGSFMGYGFKPHKLMLTALNCRKIFPNSMQTPKMLRPKKTFSDKSLMSRCL